LGFGSQLKIKTAAVSRTADIAAPLGIVVGAATPVPFTGILKNRIYIGIALFLLPDMIVRVIAHAPADVFYPLYDNRTQRLLILPALALRLFRGVAAGIGFNYLAGLIGNVRTAAGATRALEARVDEAVASRVAVNAGLRWQLAPRVALALVYRQAF